MEEIYKALDRMTAAFEESEKECSRLFDAWEDAYDENKESRKTRLAERSMNEACRRRDYQKAYIDGMKHIIEML